MSHPRLQVDRKEKRPWTHYVFFGQFVSLMLFILGALIFVWLWYKGKV